jgi:hypothetical protein
MDASSPEFSNAVPLSDPSSKRSPATGQERIDTCSSDVMHGRVRLASVPAKPSFEALVKVVVMSIEHRHQEDADRTRGDHPAEYSGAHGAATDLSGAGDQRHYHRAAAQQRWRQCELTIDRWWCRCFREEDEYSEIG